jgi:WD repeat-containing protein 48
MSFKMKKFGTSSTPEVAKPVAVDEKSEDSDSRSSKTDERVIEDNFLGAVQRIRHVYEDHVQDGHRALMSAITPSLPNETPILKPPLNTTILIQEDRPDSGGVADLFEGNVGSLAQQVDKIEKVAPVWLADVLLRVSAPTPIPASAHH